MLFIFSSDYQVKINIDSLKKRVRSKKDNSPKSPNLARKSRNNNSGENENQPNK